MTPSVAAILADENCCRQTERFARPFQDLENLGRSVGVKAQIFHADFCQEGFRPLQPRGVDIHRDDGEILGQPSSACKRSSAGISCRQGTHQVAQRFSSTVRPLKSARPVCVPSAAANFSSGSGAAGSKGSRPRSRHAPGASAAEPAPARPDKRRSLRWSGFLAVRRFHRVKDDSQRPPQQRRSPAMRIRRMKPRPLVCASRLASFCVMPVIFSKER